MFYRFWSSADSSSGGFVAWWSEQHAPQKKNTHTTIILVCPNNTSSVVVCSPPHPSSRPQPACLPRLDHHSFNFLSMLLTTPSALISSVQESLPNYKYTTTPTQSLTLGELLGRYHLPCASGQSVSLSFTLFFHLSTFSF